jgi:hypothetical protein
MDRYKISEDRRLLYRIIVLCMMHINDTCSESWSRFVSEDINSTVKHPEFSSGYFTVLFIDQCTEHGTYKTNFSLHFVFSRA